jgi:hypothetical protein
MARRHPKSVAEAFLGGGECRTVFAMTDDAAAQNPRAAHHDLTHHPLPKSALPPIPLVTPFRDLRKNRLSGKALAAYF